jgi:DNA helicase-2/ATP-dependent DNA helicase PcrA
VLEDGLRRANIPYQIVGGLKFYDRQEIKDVLAYLRLLSNPLDTLSLRRIINVPRRGIGQVSWSRMEALAEERGLHGLAILPAVLDSDAVSKSVRSKLRSFYGLMQALRDDASQMDVADITREVLNRTGYADQLDEEQTAEARTRLENVRELVNAAQEFDRYGEGEGLQDFLSQTALLSDQDHLDDDSGSVVLMTLHASKGLEFPVVFIAGMENGLFPHNRSFDEPAEMEEERLLCYVGITRAQQRLFLTGAARRRIYGVEQTHRPSLFLGDMPPACIQDFSPQPVLGVARQAWESGLAPDASLAAELQVQPAATARRRQTSGVVHTPYGVGTQVYHQHFGRGVVQKREGEGEQLKLTVLFRDRGSKKILANFAPMEPL